MVQLSVNEADVWALNAAGAIYKRRVNELDNPAGVWTSVAGPVLSKISTGGNFVWGINGTNIYYTLTTTFPGFKFPILKASRMSPSGQKRFGASTQLEMFSAGAASGVADGMQLTEI